MIKCSALVSAALAAAIVSGVSFAADAPLKPDAEEMKGQMAAISGVRAPAGQVDMVMRYCGDRFVAMKADMSQASDGWHARNGGWERAATALAESLRERMVARKMVEDAPTFDSTLQGILDHDVEKMRTKFDGIADDEQRKAACTRFREAIDGGRFDVETLWPDALPKLRPYLK